MKQFSDGSNKRKHVRTAVLLKVEYRQRADMLADYIVNLGEGGMFIRTNFPFQLGQEIRCAVSFPGLLAPIEVSSVVRWRQFYDPARPENPPGVGVEFLREDAEACFQIKALVEQVQQIDREGAKGVRFPSKFSVLLIDGNPFTRELFHYAVRCFHQLHSPSETVLEIHDAETSEQAMMHLRGRTIDLVICEPFVPGYSGPELIAQLRRKCPPIVPILIVSAGSAKTKALCLQSGADFYLEKPVLRSQLVNTITMLLAQRGEVSTDERLAMNAG